MSSNPDPTLATMDGAGNYRLAVLPDGPKIVVVSFGSPYLLRHFPDVDAYLCLYKDTPEAQAIAARALAGELHIDYNLE